MEINSPDIFFDSWITENLNKDAYRIDVTERFKKNISKKGTTESNWLEMIKSNPAFVFTKIPAENISQVQLVEKIGFHLIDTNVTFRKKIAIEKYTELPNQEYSVGFAEQKDRGQTTALGRDGFRYSRFHLDPNILQAVANEIKAQWVENYFNGKRGDKMIVAKTSDKVVGFLQIIEKEDHYIIDLVAVDQDLRKKGIAIQMLNFAENYYRQQGLSYIIVGTQLANIPSIKFYQKMGFIFDSAKYVFHYQN